MRHMLPLLALAVASFPQTARAESPSDTVPVKMAGAQNMVLERAIENTGLWESLCVGECNARVPWNGWYRVTGHGLRPSMPIGLVTSRSDGAVHLEPHPAYTAGFIGGLTLAGVGPVVFFGGLIAIAADNHSDVTPFGCPTCQQVTQVNNAPIIAGALSMAVGGAMTIAGVLIAMLSHHTSTSQRLATTSRNITLKF